MKIKLTLLLTIFTIVNAFSQAPTLSLLNSYSLTPNVTDTIGAFARIFYHTPRNKYYVIYAARQAGSPFPSGTLSNFAWVEYDANMLATGNKGSLPSQVGAGDFACVMVDSAYYHLTLGGNAKYKLTKYDDDFNVVATQTITLNSCSSNIDQLLNYTNGRLIIGAMYDAGVCPPINPPSASLAPQSQIFQYDLNLTSLATSTITTPTKITWGASMIYNAGFYYEVTMDNFNNRDLYAYKYDASFNYLSSTLLSSDGQWSQGVLWNAGYYYVAHHTGDHNHGNVVISIYDNNWVLQNTTNVTTFAVLCPTCGTSYNANRPFLLKNGNKLYVSYDIETYTNYVNKKDWQSAVKVYQISTPTSIMEEDRTNSDFEVFPNPSSNIISVNHIDGKTNFIYEIYDILGKSVLSSNSNTINIASLTNGVYSLNIKDKTSGDLLSIKKIIKE